MPRKAKSTKPRPLLSRRQAASFTKMAKDPKIGPEMAGRALKFHLYVQQAVRSFGVDAIEHTSRRRSPISQVESVDQQFSGAWDRNKMIGTSRDVVQNYSMARGLINIHVNNVVGTGPKMQVRTRDIDWNTRKESMWKRWERVADASRRMPFGWMVRVLERETIVDGDCGLVMTDRGFIQGIEGDRIKNPPDKRNSKNRSFVHGVEVDPILSPLGYHVWKRRAGGAPERYLTRIPAENFVHSVDLERYDQTRGLSAIVSALNDLQDTREALEAIKGAMKLENMLGVVWTTDLPNSGTMDPLGLFSTFTATTPDGTQHQQREVSIPQGAWSISLKPGEKVDTVQKRTPSEQFEPYMLFQARLAGIALDMPLEVALMYFARGSFSSLKGAIGQYQYSVGIKRKRIEWQVCDRLARWKISQWMNRWRRLAAISRDAAQNDPWALEPPKSDIDPYDQDWEWDQLPLLEPGKQIDADRKEYKTRASTLTAINARRNQDFEATVRTQAREIKTIERVAEEEDVAPERLYPEVTLPGEKTPSDGADDGDDSGQAGDDE